MEMSEIQGHHQWVKGLLEIEHRHKMELCEYLYKTAMQHGAKHEKGDS